MHQAAFLRWEKERWNSVAKPDMLIGPKRFDPGSQACGYRIVAVVRKEDNVTVLAVLMFLQVAHGCLALRFDGFMPRPMSCCQQANIGA
jgi:hypothetical protein